MNNSKMPAPLSHVPAYFITNRTTSNITPSTDKTADGGEQKIVVNMAEIKWVVIQSHT